MAEYRRPLPKPTPETQPFWDAAREHRLSLQRCGGCGEVCFPPRSICPARGCHSSDLTWGDLSGRGRLHSYVINHRPLPGFEDIAPFAVAVVELDEGPRLMTNIIGIENTPENLVLDMAVEVVFEDVSDDITLCKFRPHGVQL